MSFSKAPRITVLGTKLTIGESNTAGKKKVNKKANLPIPIATSTPGTTSRYDNGNAISVLENQLKRQTNELRRDNGNLKLQVNKLKQKLADVPSPGEKIWCPICMDSSKQVASEDSEHGLLKRRMVSTPCGHIFCNECLRKALKRAPCCPKCRTVTVFSKCHQLYFN